jgi:uncharacterized protein RhaS with RHS repeats
LVDRYYDPATGQFLTVDPDVSETGEPYAYTGGDHDERIRCFGVESGPRTYSKS